MLQLYCDVCGAEKHFEADNMSDCIYKAQHEGWFEYPSRVVACEKCKKEVDKHYGRTSRI